MKYILPFRQVRITDVGKVGGKNASLGEMLVNLSAAGVSVPDGFALTADAFRAFIRGNDLEEKLQQILKNLDNTSLANLPSIGKQCRDHLHTGNLPDEVRSEVLACYREFSAKTGPSVAVRSSATAEDLPDASFAGQHESFLNINGEKELLEAIKKCYISLYNDRAIKYRLDHGFSHQQVAISVGIQHMVRSDLGAAGVAFTLDPESGFRNVIYITAAWGLGENIVQGAVNPDEFYVFKPHLEKQRPALINKKLGDKLHKMIYTPGGKSTVKNVETSEGERNSYAIPDEKVTILARWCSLIEKHYGSPMDIEWAIDGETGALYIVQARPETVHSQKQKLVIKEYKLKTKQIPVCTGKAVGRSIASGKVCIVRSLGDAGKVQNGDIIVADITNPDWNALLRKAVSIVTNKGGRTSHASIVARELGIHAVVGTGNATEVLRDGQMITVSCAEGDEGFVYDGKSDWTEKEVHFSEASVRTKPMLILADPGKAFRLSMYPNEGVGLLRMEFIISNTIRIHPMALVKYNELPDSHDKRAIAAITKNFPDKRRYFVEQLAGSLAMVAAAFHPREVIVRMSDFKTNEYAQLIGGKTFEPGEENPMLGFRGASRYYNPLYKEGFGLECEALRVLRDERGFTNIKAMIPFCRTLKEAEAVLDTMKEFGLERGKNGLEVYMMAEIPSNIILAAEFSKMFDGFSIGSNDLTQLTLGIDRDSATISQLFDENDEAVKRSLSHLIKTAHKCGVKVGLCGQAPSDHPGFARFLVELGIDSISFTPDALLQGIENIREAEKILNLK